MAVGINGCPSGTIRRTKWPFRAGGSKTVRPPARQLFFDRGGETGDHVLAGRLVVDDFDFCVVAAQRSDQFAVIGGRPHDQRMVVPVDDQPSPRSVSTRRNPLPCRISVRRRRRPRLAFYRDEQLVGMAVDFAARTVVSGQRMCHFERKFLGKSNCCHRVIPPDRVFPPAGRTIRSAR